MIGKCSFCGMTTKVTKSNNVCICNNCCQTIIDQSDLFDEEIQYKIESILKPHEIKKQLDNYIVGQEEAKKILSVAVYNHYKLNQIKNKTNIQNSNILLIGPTGSGKTYIMQVLAKILNIPFVITDSTNLTVAGYVGDSVSDILKDLYIKANGDINLAEEGIVYIDEVDKLVSKSTDYSKKDINGSGVQQSFLRMMEGGEVSFSMGTDMQNTNIIMDTSKILFVFGGAFVGIENILKERLNPKTSIGFNTFIDDKNEPINIKNNIIQSDLIKYGFIPEFIGRIPVILNISPLQKDELKSILIKPKNAIVKQYKELLKPDGVSIDFDDEAINYIVNEATKKNLGARGLKGIICKPMDLLMYELPKYPNIKQMTITKELLENPMDEFKKIKNRNRNRNIANAN